MERLSLNTPTPLPRRFLAACMAAFFAPAGVAGDDTAALPPFIVDAGDDLLIDPGDYATSGDSGSVLIIRGGGTASADDVRFTTSGKDAYAINVTGADSYLSLSNARLTTDGVGAYAVKLANTGSNRPSLFDHVDIVTREGGATGARLSDAIAGFAKGSIVTAGYAAHGIDATDGATATIDGTAIATSGGNASGMVGSGDGTGLRANAATIMTKGDESHGIYVESGAQAVAIDTSIGTEGADAHAINVNSGAGLVTVEGSHLSTLGERASAVGIYDGSGPVRLAQTTIATSGRSAPGIDNRGAFAEVDRITIKTTGASSYGMLAKGAAAPGMSPMFQATAVDITTAGSFAHGARAETGGRIVLAGSSIETTGANGHGLYSAAGEVSVSDTRVHVTGKDAYGALVLTGGKLTVKGGSIASGQFAALGVLDPSLVRIGGDAVLKGGNGAFVDIDPTSTKPFTIVLDDTAQAFGDIRFSDDPRPPSDETKASVAIRHGAVWSGATAIVRNVDVENGGTWRVTGDSVIGALRNDNGVVAFASPGAGSVSTLTITGNYEGRNGLIHLRTWLGDDTSASDLVHVQGNASGTTRLAIAPLGGNGAYNAEGIPVVRVDGASDGTFTLAGRVVGGSNEYFLHKGSVSQPDDGNWYLRSAVPEQVVDPEEGDDDDPIAPPVVPPSVPLLRPETGTYRANQTAVLEMFQAGPGAGEDDEPDVSRGAAWARFERNHTTFDFRDQITTTTASNELTLGADVWRGGESTQAYVGVMGAVGQANTSGTSLVTGYTAKGRVRGAAGGIYGGLRTEAGSYIRGWTRFARFNERVEGSGLPVENYDSNTVSGSIEGGHRWRATLTKDTDAYIEPQAQIVATRLNGGVHTEANGARVSPRHASGVTGRIGLRSAARWQTPGGHVASPYLTANWLRRLGRLDATQLGGETFTGGVPRNAYALKLGVTFLRHSGWRFWGDVETRFGARNYRRVAGTFGIRRTW